jgi:DNA modification methylase
MQMKARNKKSSIQAKRLTITYLPIDNLKPDPRNPRQHSDRQIKQISRSIESFGFNAPVVIDRNNNILCGHGRVLACQRLGWHEVPTIQLEHLTEAQAKAFAIADNRLTENSIWDDQLLGAVLSELSGQELDFSLEDTGFTMAEIDLKIEGVSASSEKASDPADQIPDISDGPPVSKPGDLWLLGKHRILCDNAMDGLSYENLMKGVKAHLVFSDPPYNVKIDGHCTGLGATKHREFAMAAGEMSELEFTDFLLRICRHLALNSRSGSMHYICMDWRHILELLTAGKQIYRELKNICVWSKDNAGMGSLYRSQHELICVFKHGASSHRNNVQLGQYGRYRTNVWEYAGANSFSRKDEDSNMLGLHPTAKPVALVADAILDASARGDIILDNFLGSGTTLLAAERVGRVCYGMELDPLYVDTAIRRWQRYSGDKAIHVVTGICFDDLASAQEARHG